jgi:hypothetical protein
MAIDGAIFAHDDGGVRPGIFAGHGSHESYCCQLEPHAKKQTWKNHAANDLRPKRFSLFRKGQIFYAPLLAQSLLSIFSL